MADGKKYIHKLRRISGYSYSVIVPKDVIERYGWREKQKLLIVDKGRGRLEIKDWRRR
jgi:bifunctional DNA-binding transcriptional regulator/antitoxin component of YhaV-PrlF toxin-antitoxin module